MREVGYFLTLFEKFVKIKVFDSFGNSFFWNSNLNYFHQLFFHTFVGLITDFKNQNRRPTLIIFW